MSSLSCQIHIKTFFYIAVKLSYPWVLWALMFPLYAFQQVCLVAEVAGGWNDEVPTRAVVVVSAADVAE